MSKQIEFIPVKNNRGEIELYDIYVDGTWIGSRRTLAQCELAVKCYAH